VTQGALVFGKILVPTEKSFAVKKKRFSVEQIGRAGAGGDGGAGSGVDLLGRHQ